MSIYLSGLLPLLLIGEPVERLPAVNTYHQFGEPVERLPAVNTYHQFF